MLPKLHQGVHARYQRAWELPARLVMSATLAVSSLVAETHTFKDPNSPWWPGGAACPSGQERKWRLNSGSPWISSSQVEADSKTKCDSNIATLGYGHCRYSTTFGISSGTVAQSYQYKANADHVVDPYVYTYQSYNSQCQTLPPVLTLQAGGEVRAGEPLGGQRLEVVQNGQPAANIPVQITAQPGDAAWPAAELRPIAGEAASCTAGSAMSCTTDADGVIEFEFYVPSPDLGFDTNYTITGRCSDPAKPCSPDPVGPAVVTVEGCPLQLSLVAAGTVNPGESELTGLVAEVTGCGDPANNVPLQISTWAQLLAQASGALYPEADSLALCNPGATMNCTTDATGRIQFKFDSPEPPPTMDVLHNLTATCTASENTCTPNPAGPEIITVKGCVALSLDAGGQVEPEMQLPNQFFPVQRVRAATCDGTPAANVRVELKATAEPSSGSHEHGEPPSRPPGEIIPATSECTISGPAAWICPTNTSGEIPFGFLAPQAAGIHRLTARCADAVGSCQDPSPATVTAKVDDLEQIPYSEFYTLTELAGTTIGGNIGDNGKHDGLNHNLTPAATAALEQLAADYAQTFQPPELPPAPLHVNDASLPSGGLFDVYGDWKSPHMEHRRGTVVDVRANLQPGNVPE